MVACAFKMAPTLMLLLAAGLAVASAGSATIGNPTLDETEGHPPYIHPKTQGWVPHKVAFSVDPTAVITVSSYVLNTNPATYTVSWSGVTTRSPYDVIGFWSPGELNASAAAPVMWSSANVTGYLETGSGSANFTTYNLRNNLIFRLVSGSTTFPNPTIIAESPLIINQIPNFPSQVHLSLADDGRSIVVQFVSNTSNPIPVMYGLAPGQYTGTVQSIGVTYTKDMMCGGPAKSTAFTDPGWTHTAIIPYNAIGNNRRVYYQVGDNIVGKTREFSFISPVEVGSADPVKFVVFNDVGSISETLFNDTCVCTNYTAGVTPPSGSGYCTNNTDGSQSCCSGYCPIPPGTPPGQDWYLSMFQYTPNSIKLAPVLVAEESDANMAILNGDLSYAQGYTDSWDIFGHQMEPAFSQWPLMTGCGNHERDWPGTGDAFSAVPGGVHDSGGECNVAYTYRYYNPGPGSTLAPHLDTRSSYYSFAMGSVFFLVIDTETATDAASPQGMWIRQTLDKINRKKTPWTVVSTHRMMEWMSTDTRPVQGDNAVCDRLLHDLEDVFHGRVHIVTSGHQHCYGRTCMVYKGNCTRPRDTTFFRKPDAPIYVVTGNAGAGFTHVFPKNVPDWVAFGFQDLNGYVRFEADRRTLTMQAIATDPLDWSQGSKGYTFGAGAVFDSITLSLD